MLLIEPCIKNEKISYLARKVGYDILFIENGFPLSRITIPLRHSSNFLKNVNNYKNYDLIVVKPLSIEALRVSILSKAIHMIHIDNDNFYLMRKSMLNLIKIKNKFIEINLNSSSSYIIYKSILWGYKWIKNLIFSLCAKETYELWSPSSKLSYIIIHGADEEMAMKWVFINPQLLLYHVTRNT